MSGRRVFIDPPRPVDRAVITHGHADHARAGHNAVLATVETLAITGERPGADFAGRTQAPAYGERFRIGSAEVSLAPAGHVAQQPDHALRLTQGASSDQVGALGERLERAQQTPDLLRVRRVVKDRQAVAPFSDARPR